MEQIIYDLLLYANLSTLVLMVFAFISGGLVGDLWKKKQ